MKLSFGPMHAAVAASMRMMRDEIDRAEALIAKRKAELAHFEESMEALMGITDPETIPAPQNLAAGAANAAAGTDAGVAQTEASMQSQVDAQHAAA